MADAPKDKARIEERLWGELEKARIGMLGLVGRDAPTQPFQPMTAFAEAEDGRLWFFTRTDTDLARAAANGAEAMFVLQSKDQDLQACLTGRLAPRPDPARIDRYWSPMVAAWYPDGKDDPRLTLLCFDAREASVWITEAGPVKYAWEVARANATRRPPDVGDRAELDLSR